MIVRVHTGRQAAEPALREKSCIAHVVKFVSSRLYYCAHWAVIWSAFLFLEGTAQNSEDDLGQAESRMAPVYETGKVILAFFIAQMPKGFEDILRKAECTMKHARKRSRYHHRNR